MPAAAAWAAIWANIPAPIKSLFFVGLILAVVWALYQLLSS